MGIGLFLLCSSIIKNMCATLFYGDLSVLPVSGQRLMDSWIDLSSSRGATVSFTIQLVAKVFKWDTWLHFGAQG